MDSQVLIEQYKNVCTRYDQIRYHYAEGLIPDEIYLKELDIIQNYLQGIKEQLEENIKQIQEEQNDR